MHLRVFRNGEPVKKKAALAAFFISALFLQRRILEQVSFIAFLFEPVFTITRTFFGQQHIQ